MAVIDGETHVMVAPDPITLGCSSTLLHVKMPETPESMKMGQCLSPTSMALTRAEPVLGHCNECCC